MRARPPSRRFRKRSPQSGNRSCSASSSTSSRGSVARAPARSRVMRVFNRHVSMRGLTVFGFETVLDLRLDSRRRFLPRLARRTPRRAVEGGLVTALCELCFYYNDLYDLTRVHAKRELAVARAAGHGAAAIALAAVSLLSRRAAHRHRHVHDTSALLLVAVPVWRLAFDGLTQRPASRGARARRRHRSAGAHRRASRSAPARFRLPDRRLRRGGGRGTERRVAPVIGAPTELPRIIRVHHVDRIVVSLTDRRGKLPIASCCRPSSPASAWRTRRRPTSG